ncbi:MAG: response regulator transcription factor [Steroidobacteraceae bacterium]
MQSLSVSPIRVLVVDGHGIVRHGLSALLDGQSDMRVVGTAADGRAAVRAAAELNVHVVVMDLALPKLSGIDATLRILAAQSNVRIVILSAADTADQVMRAISAGARGYILKESAAAEILNAVAAVCKGERYLSPRMADLLIDAMLLGAGRSSPIDSLSPREREVLQLTVTGASSAMIGKQLSLSRKTVDTYRSRLMGKLGVPNLAGLIRFAAANALAPL